MQNGAEVDGEDGTHFSDYESQGCGGRDEIGKLAASPIHIITASLQHAHNP